MCQSDRLRWILAWLLKKWVGDVWRGAGRWCYLAIVIHKWRCHPQSVSGRNIPVSSHCRFSLSNQLCITNLNLRWLCWIKRIYWELREMLYSVEERNIPPSFISFTKRNESEHGHAIHYFIVYYDNILIDSLENCIKSLQRLKLIQKW